MANGEKRTDNKTIRNDFGNFPPVNLCGYTAVVIANGKKVSKTCLIDIDWFGVTTVFVPLLVPFIICKKKSFLTKKYVTWFDEIMFSIITPSKASKIKRKITHQQTCLCWFCGVGDGGRGEACCAHKTTKTWKHFKYVYGGKWNFQSMHIIFIYMYACLFIFYMSQFLFHLSCICTLAHMILDSITIDIIHNHNEWIMIVMAAWYLPLSWCVLMLQKFVSAQFCREKNRVWVYFNWYAPQAHYNGHWGIVKKSIRD